MRVLIAGGSGFLGRALGRALRDEGHHVKSLTRRPRGLDDIRWDAATRDTAWTSALEEAGAVINLAGESIASGRWTAARKAAIRDSRVAATRALAGAINTAGKPVIFLSGSAVGFYGLRGDDLLTEEAAAGTDFLATVCRDWEGEALKATAASRIVLLRSGLVLAKEGGALPRMALPFRFGAGGRVGTGRQYVSWIHIDDWVGIVGGALEDHASGPWNLTAPNPVPNAEFARALGRAIHRPAVVPAPGFALRLALGEMADALLLGGQRVVPEKAGAAGYRFRYPTLEAALENIYARGSP